ncbi:MAG: hypothetical protein KL785_02445, partial [Brevundimonas sp.]|nr:hypothetical protein [Brevundimonas sp.]
PPETVVMLAGGGSPSKDLLIIEGLLAHPSMADRSIAYHVLDISPFMLFRTQEVLRRSLPKARGGSRVKPAFFGEDVLALQHAGSDRLRGPRHYAILHHRRDDR